MLSGCPSWPRAILPWPSSFAPSSSDAWFKPRTVCWSGACRRPRTRSWFRRPTPTSVTSTPCTESKPSAQFELAENFRLNINLSTRQVLDAQLIDRIRSLVLTTGVQPSGLCLEIQADAIAHAPFEARRLIHGLADDGIRICVEDFGLGTCTVDELRRLPIDALKVDRQFVERLDGTSSTTGRVKHVADAARALRADLIGEGIENELQRNVLRWLGCKIGQGYLFARPMTVGDASPIWRVTSNRARPA